MKHLKMLSLATVAFMATAVFAASSASATTLEETGVTKNSSVTLTASLEAGTKLIRGNTSGLEANSCSESNLHGNTTAFTPTPTGPITELTFKNCDVEGTVIHKMGKLYIEWDGGTHGELFSEEAEFTVPTTFGVTVNCKTGAGNGLGTLTGVAAGNATLHVNAVLSCGFLLPSATWKGIYVFTSPNGLGVSP